MNSTSKISVANTNVALNSSKFEKMISEKNNKDKLDKIFDDNPKSDLSDEIKEALVKDFDHKPVGKIKEALEQDDGKYIQEAPYGVEVKTDPETGKHYLTKPQTREFEAHDKAAEEAMARWEEENPEPNMPYEPYLLIHKPPHQNWEEKRAKAYEEFERQYRLDHPDYEVQAIYYDQKQAELKEKNKPSFGDLVRC